MVVHELTHSVVHKVFGPYGGSWFQEGFAVYVETLFEKKDPVTFTEAFSEAMLALAEKNSNIIAITAAMTHGTGLAAFEKRFPQRFFDVGICEQHAITFAAGLACQGLTYCGYIFYIYATGSRPGDT